MRHRYEIAILFIALFGVALGLYALSLHYAPTGSRICNINDTFNCDAVNKSDWSTFLGVPVALLGAFAYLVVFLLVLLRNRVKQALAFTDRDFWGYVVLLTIFMMLFQGYLTMAEALWIKAYCIICLGSQTLTIALVALATARWRAAAAG